MSCRLCVAPLPTPSTCAVRLLKVCAPCYALTFGASSGVDVLVERVHAEVDAAGWQVDVLLAPEEWLPAAGAVATRSTASSSEQRSGASANTAAAPSVWTKECVARIAFAICCTKRLVHVSDGSSAAPAGSVGTGVATYLASAVTFIEWSALQATEGERKRPRAGANGVGDVAVYGPEAVSVAPVLRPPSARPRRPISYRLLHAHDVVGAVVGGAKAALAATASSPPPQAA